MKQRQTPLLILGAVLLGAFALSQHQQETPLPSATATAAAAASAPGRASDLPDQPAVHSLPDAKTAASTAAWPAAPVAGRQPDMFKIVAFNHWLESYTAASPEARAALTGEGRTLAAARRPEFKKLITTNPQRALAMTVSRVIRQDLPEAITAELEKPVTARGNFNAYFGRPIDPAAVPADQELVLRYFETPAGESYYARVFGSLLEQTSRKDVALQGVALDRELAVAASPVRPLEKGERIPAGTVVDETCPVSKITTPAATEETVTVADETPYVELAGRLILLCNGTHVRIFEESQRMANGGPGVAGYFKDNYPGTSSEAIGNFRCLYIRVTYPDQMRAPNTEASAQGDMRNVSRYYLESSFGRMTTTSAVTPLIVMPHTRAWYIAKDSEVDGLGLVHSDARSEARKLGYDSNQYNCTIVRVNEGPRLSGISWGGGDSVWVSWDGMDVLNHECGHSLGRNHANFWQTSDGSAIGVGANEEYGNNVDVMGGGFGFGAHYNTYSKRVLGWLPDNNLHRPGNTPASNGIYRIYAYDQPVLEEVKRYSLRVDKDPERRFYLEYHPAAGGLWTDSLLMIMSGLGSNAGHLVDTTPGSSGGKGDGGIVVGRTFSDYESDLHFTVLSRQNTTPPSLDLAMMRGPFPGNVAPAINSLTASATTAAVNASLTFTADASDANGDTLAYQWDFSDGAITTNTPVLTRTFTAAAQQTVGLTVSDMKGGIARRHEIITIGSPGRATIRGRITQDGQPLMGVRLTSDTGKYCYTDTNGDYAMAGLTTGSRTLTATLTGYTFTPGFTNPVSLALSGATGQNWTATSVPQLTITATDTAEGGAAGSFVLARSGSAAAALTVRAAPFTGTAVKTSDYTFFPAQTATGTLDSFTIPAGQASLTITITPVNDTAQEGPETIQLQAAAGAYQVRNSGVAILTIADNDTTRPVVKVESTDPNATETPGDAATFRISRTGDPAAALNLTAAWSGTASRGNDYPNLATTITIPAGQATTSISLVPADDTVIEIPEDAILTLGSNAAYIINPSANTATITIADNDLATVTVSVLDDTLNEASRGTGTVLLTRTGNLTQPLKVYYGLSGRAIHGTDYIALPGEATFAAGMESVPVVVTPYDDDLGEGDESITFNLTAFNSTYALSSNYTAALTIKDNADPPLVTVTANSAAEPSTNGTFTFTATTTVTTPFTVNYTLSGTASAGTDFTARSGSITISPTAGATSHSATVSIPVLNDAIPENTETIVLTTTPAAGYALYNDTSATMRLRDDDSEAIAVSNHSSTLAEPASASSFYLSRAGTAGSLAVSYTLSGTATNGTDYTLLSGTATIPDTATGVDIRIAPINDAIAEGTESVILTVIPGPGYGTEVPSAVLYLGDDDAGAMTSMGFLSATGTTSEAPDPTNGGFRSIEVTLSAAATVPVTAEYTMGGGTAAGDAVDWNFADSTGHPIPGGILTFPPGSLSQTIRIKVRDDGLPEGPETAILELRHVNGGRLSASRNKHTLTITENTAANPVPRVSLLTTATTRSEADGTDPLLIVILDAPAANSVSVSYAVTGTATSGADYTLPNATLTFAAGETAKKLPLLILPDVSTEPRETIIVTLSSPVGSLPGPVTTHTITLTDSNSPVLAVAASAPEISEDSGSGIFTLSRAGGSNALPITAFFNLSGTAVSGIDYSDPGTLSLTIPANENSVSLLIQPISDSTLEPDKTVILTLSPDPNYEISSTSREATLTLLDDDHPPVLTLLSPASPSIAIPNGVGLYTEVSATRAVPSGLIQMPVTWTQVSGPGSALFESPTLRSTGVTFSGPGTYVLRASATHGTAVKADLTVAVGATTAPPVEFTPALTRFGDMPATTGYTPGGPGVYNLTTGGASIPSNGTADQFLFLHQPISGNCVFTARIVSAGTGGPTVSDNRSGVMMRESLTDGGSMHAFMALTKAPATRFITRTATSATSSAVNGTGTFPRWVRLVRTGDTFRGDTAPDVSGNPGTWTTTGTTTIPMGDTVYAGLASANGSATLTTAVVIDNIKILNYTGVSNAGPNVNAGSDRTGSGPFILDATLTDDGLPAPTRLITAWTTVNGPGSAIFANPGAVDTALTLPASGLYTLRLSAHDSQITTYDDTTVDFTGLPIETWRNAQFGTSSNDPLLSGDLADPDHDGLCNLVEYALNSDPWTSIPGHQPTPRTEGNALTLTYRLNSAATDITVILQTSPDLDNWVPATATLTTFSDDGITRVIQATQPILPTTGHLYLRLHVTH